MPRDIYNIYIASYNRFLIELKAQCSFKPTGKSLETTWALNPRRSAKFGLDGALVYASSLFPHDETDSADSQKASRARSNVHNLWAEWTEIKTFLHFAIGKKSLSRHALKCRKTFASNKKETVKAQKVCSHKINSVRTSSNFHPIVSVFQRRLKGNEEKAAKRAFVHVRKLFQRSRKRSERSQGRRILKHVCLVLHITEPRK